MERKFLQSRGLSDGAHAPPPLNSQESRDLIPNVAMTTTASDDELHPGEHFSEGEEKDEDSSDDGTDHRAEDFEYENLAKPIFDLIQQFSLRTARNSPPPTASIAVFRNYWYIEFGRLHRSLVDAGEADLLITDPPLDVLEIEILAHVTEGQKECPCCLPYREADIVILPEEGEEGITRGAFVKAVGEGLYGGDVRKDGVGRIAEKKLVVRSWDYMMQDEDTFYKGSTWDRMRVWMYCEEMESASTEPHGLRNGARSARL